MDVKGYFFSTDAAIAASLLLTGVFLLSQLYVSETQTTTIENYAQDTLNILSTITIGELKPSERAALEAEGVITKQDYNRTLLEKAGQLWAEGNAAHAQRVLNVSNGTLPAKFQIGVFYGNEFVYGSNSTPAAGANLISTKRIISGIAKDKPVEGYSAGAQIISVTSRSDFAEYHFGGFIGQGNITARFELPDDITSITNAVLELDVSDNFTLRINGNYSGTYLKGSGGGGAQTPDLWIIDPSYVQWLHPGENTLNITFQNSIGHIGGGYFKVNYFTSDINSSNVTFYSGGTKTERYYFPRVDGVINVFDSFYVPGTLEEMALRLHYKTEFTTFLTIGNTTLYRKDERGEFEVELDDNNLSNTLTYADMSKKTIPLRVGSATGNASTLFVGGIADVMLVNDMSGSIEYCAQNACSTSNGPNQDYCSTGHNQKPLLGTYCDFEEENWQLPNGSLVCSFRWQSSCPAGDVRKIDIVNNASVAFTDIILDAVGNRLGIVGYSSPIYSDVVHVGDDWGDKFSPFPDGIVADINLTLNVTSLIYFIEEEQDTYWETCTCCGVRRAWQTLDAMSDEDRYRTMVVMTDGQATDKCTGVGIGNAKQDAIDEAQKACSTYNVSVNTVAFGADADVDMLQQMACGDGQFYSADDVNELIEIYKQIANEINNITYKEQDINTSGIFPAEGILYEDSYIEYSYTPSFVGSFGKIPAKVQSSPFGNNVSQHTLTILPSQELAEVHVISYSGEKWTDNLTIQNSNTYTAFDLGRITDNYLQVGDPFVVHADPSLFVEGANLIHISTGVGPENYTGGSPNDRVTYTVLIDNAVPQSGVHFKSDGCEWSLDFEDGTSTTLLVPLDYTGSETCDYQAASYPGNDALDDAVYRLLTQLDFDGNGLIDVTFQQDGLDVNTFVVQNVPSLWGPTIVEVRLWQ